MTLSAVEGDRTPYGKTVKVRFTYGPTNVDFTEPVEYVRSFWAELGRLLDQLEHEEGEHA